MKVSNQFMILVLGSAVLLGCGEKSFEKEPIGSDLSTLSSDIGTDTPTGSGGVPAPTPTPAPNAGNALPGFQITCGVAGAPDNGGIGPRGQFRWRWKPDGVGGAYSFDGKCFCSFKDPAHWFSWGLTQQQYGDAIIIDPFAYGMLYSGYCK